MRSLSLERYVTSEATLHPSVGNVEAMNISRFLIYCCSLQAPYRLVASASSLVRSKPKQIQSCLMAETPTECPEKEAGALECKPVLPGIFSIRERDIKLHVGLDARNDLTCMIQADAILTGCSAFGQIAGVLSEGVKFFPVGCEGYLTDPHYKMLPPLVRGKETGLCMYEYQANCIQLHVTA